MKNIEKSVPEYKNSNMMRIVKGVITSLVITILLLLLFSIILTYTNVSENTIAPVIIIITVIAILIGSSISTIKLSKNGIVYGTLIALIYILLLYLISSIMNSQFMLNTHSIILIVSSMLAGAIGGVIGINIK